MAKFDDYGVSLLAEVTERLIVAQAVTFFIAGFFTSSNAMSHLLYELALNQHMQERVRVEIREVLKVTKGELEYDTIKRMDYLDAVFKGKAAILNQAFVINSIRERDTINKLYSKSGIMGTV